MTIRAVDYTVQSFFFFFYDSTNKRGTSCFQMPRNTEKRPCQITSEHTFPPRLSRQCFYLLRSNGATSVLIFYRLDHCLTHDVHLQRFTDHCSEEVKFVTQKSVDLGSKETAYRYWQCKFPARIIHECGSHKYTSQVGELG